MDARVIIAEAGAGGNATVMPDGTANIIDGDTRLCFGLSANDDMGNYTGDFTGWDATEYVRDGEDAAGPIWKEARSTWCETDGEMIALAATYA